MASICTLTLNPAVDTSCQVDRVVPDRKLRCTRPTREPGGGGLNVARAIRILGGDAEAIWTRGGTTGQLLAELLDGEGVPHRPVPIEGLSRESLMVYETTTERQYRFQMPGPELDRRALDAVTDAVTGRQPVPEYLVLSGSLPPGAPDDFYARLAASVDPSVRVIVDTSGAALQRTVECGVFLIKPNVGELSALVDDPLENDAAVETAARGLLRGDRAEVVAVSLGAGGALVVTRDGCEHVRSPTVPIRSRVGAGDSMVAGTVLALSRGLGTTEAVKFGVATGAAAVMTPGSELCRREDAERLYQSMQ
jgi:6-phosphofructokinase 2